MEEQRESEDLLLGLPFSLTRLACGSQRVPPGVGGWDDGISEGKEVGRARSL